MATNHDNNLLDILIEMADSLKNVSIENRFNFDDITKKYKEAIFKVKQKEERGGNIISSNLQSETLFRFYKDHACCWVNYIGCDSFSDKERRQVFFSSILMEDEDKVKNKELLEINDRIFQLYNAMLDEKIPADLWVQLFFLDNNKLNKFMESRSISEAEQKHLSNLLDIIQKKGLMIPLRSVANAINSNDAVNLLHISARAEAVSAENVEDLKIDKDEVDSYGDVIGILQSVLNNEEYSSYLSDKIFRLNKSLHHKAKFLYYLPADGANGAVGLIIYGAERQLTSTELRDLKLLGYNILFPYVSAYKSAWENEKVIKESIKSAVSAIMSRNMSHNLGSHYMYYTKAYLEKKAMDEGSIAPDIRGAAKVLGYVQARMDYLATVISNDKYPYGPVNFKSQIYDELTVDDFSHRHFPDESNKRTTNFLLTNLILSENFSRPNVRDDASIPVYKNKLFLHVKYSDDGKKYQTFTGSWYSSGIDWVRAAIKKGEKIPTKRNEQEVKNVLSSLVIALPGGPMSCHALFNVIENFIRNSAKYLRNDIKKDFGLVCSIAIRPNCHDQGCIDLIIYDNKRNANKNNEEKKGKKNDKSESLYEQILDKLGDLNIVDEDNKISKDNKGFKEMLFSSIWMRAYTYGNKTYADVVSEINLEKDRKKKLGLIEKYGFSLVRVVDNPKSGVRTFDRQVNYTKRSSLGIIVTLPIFSHCQKLELNKNETEIIKDMLNIKADIVELDKNKLPLSYKNVFTRIIDIKDSSVTTDLEKYKKVISDRFAGIDSYSLCFMDEDGVFKEKSYDKVKKKYKIYFQRHMNTQTKAKRFDKYAYADTISGGDFTVTLLDLYKKGLVKDGTYIDDESNIFALKIKESALTRITIIDERLYKSTNIKDYPWLSLKNIRVLNYDEGENETCDFEQNQESFSLIHAFVGSKFRKDANYSNNETHFMSIHLGLIEKILKNSDYVNKEINKRTNVEKNPHNLLSETRVKTFVEMLKECFGNKTGELFVAIHSGRGNYSAELEGPLKNYPFLSLSALESAFNNSKYQLCQLLYNTVYIGKGRANLNINNN